MSDGLHDSPVVLSTPRLVLTTPPPEQADEVAAFFARNNDRLAPWDPPRPRDFLEASYWRNRLVTLREDARNDRGFRLFPRWKDRPDGPVIGSIGVTQVQRGPRCCANLGYAIDGEVEGRGLMTEALEAVIAYAFGPMNLHRIEAGYLPHNVRSARVLKRLGFVVEGYARDYLFVGGQWEDSILTARVNPRPIAHTL